MHGLDLGFISKLTMSRTPFVFWSRELRDERDLFLDRLGMNLRPSTSRLRWRSFSLVADHCKLPWLRPTCLDAGSRPRRTGPRYRRGCGRHEDGHSLVPKAGDQLAYLASPHGIEAAHRLIEKTNSGSFIRDCASPTRCSIPFEYFRSCFFQLFPRGRRLLGAVSVFSFGSSTSCQIFPEIIHDLDRRKVVVKVWILGAVADACVHLNV